MLNGGIASLAQAQQQLAYVDGVMMGRAAYQEPWRLLDVDPLMFGEPAPFASPKAAALALVPYIERELAKGVRLYAIVRHVHGLFQAVPGARAFRRHLATEGVKPGAAPPSWLMRWRWCWTGRTGFVAHRGLACLSDFRDLPCWTIARRDRIACGAGSPAPASTGILAGLFGIGGGAIIVPVLYEVFRVLDVPEEVRMQMCIGSSLAIIIPTTMRSYVAHKKKGAVIPEVVRLWSLPAVVGVAIGAVIAYFAPPALFKIVFVVFALFVAVQMLFGADRWNLGRRIARRRHSRFFRLHHRVDLVADGRERRLGVEHHVDALRPAVAAGGGDLGWDSACRSPLPARSGTCWRAGRTWRSCRRCRSASSR